MSYCRFQNTVQDLIDCRDNMDLDDQASQEERNAKMKLIELCREIARDFDDGFILGE